MRKNASRVRAGLLNGMACLGLLLATNDGAAGELTLSGSITNPGTYTISQLQALPSTTESVTVGSTTNSYTGVSLWTLLGDGPGPTPPDVITGTGKNAILRNYIVATGADGASSIVSLGEISPSFGGTGHSTVSLGMINPSFGGTSRPDLVAYQENGVTLSAPQLIVPQDASGGRNVAGLSSLNVLGVPQPPVGPGGTTSQFTVSVPGNAPVTFNINNLTSPAFQATTQTVTFLAGNTSVTDTYTGVSLWSLLSQVGAVQSDLKSKFVLATGSDGYQVLFSLAELNPGFGAPPDLIAYADTNNQLTTGGAGFARLVIPGDNFGGRFVSNLTSLTIVDVPEPRSAVLLGLGVAAIALLYGLRVRERAAGAGHEALERGRLTSPPPTGAS